MNQYCPSCGAVNEETARFCCECQAKLPYGSQFRTGGKQKPGKCRPAAQTAGQAKRRTVLGPVIVIPAVVLVLVIAVLGFALLRRPAEPSLTHPVTMPGQIAGWARLALEACNRLEDRADSLSEIGAIGSEELARAYALIDDIHLDLQNIGYATRPEEIARLQEDALDRLRECEALLGPSD